MKLFVENIDQLTENEIQVLNVLNTSKFISLGSNIKLELMVKQKTCFSQNSSFASLRMKVFIIFV
jgi:hypothetical protein